MKQTTPFAITISRQLGSGGAYVGQQLADKLTIFYADREIIRNAAKQLSVMEEDIDFREERAPSFWQTIFQSTSYIPDITIPENPIIPTDRELFEAEADVIQHMAKEHSAVIIGRCGFHILREHQNLVRIFLHSDPKERIQRIHEQYQVPEAVAEKMLIQSDKERTLYNKTYTGKEWTDAKNYDLSINTSKMDLDKVVELIINYLKIRGII